MTTPPTPIKAALIDMDGVLYDSMPYHTLAWQRMINEHGIPCTRDEFYMYEGMTGAATINLIYQREFGHDALPNEIKRMYAQKTEYFKQYPSPKVMAGASEVMDTLKTLGIKRVLVTGSAQNTLLSRLDTDFPGIFPADMRITALDVKHGKPDPEPYTRGLAKAQVEPSEAVVIENAPLGVQAGHAAGCFTLAVTTGPIDTEALYSAGADIVFPSMIELAAYLKAHNIQAPF